jgi:hypothetical protein
VEADAAIAAEGGGWTPAPKEQPLRLPSTETPAPNGRASILMPLILVHAHGQGRTEA